MIPVSEENMYPKWSDSAENQDMALDNLLKDIIHNRLQPHALTHVAARRKRKQNQGSSNEDGESKLMESTPADDVIAEVSHKKQRTGKAHVFTISDFFIYIGLYVDSELTNIVICFIIGQ